MKGNTKLTYDPYDKAARTTNKRSNWETGDIDPADVPKAGQVVYVNRPQNNAYAEECKVEILPCHAKRKNNVLFSARAHDNWTHYFTVYDIGNDVFFGYSEAQVALTQDVCRKIVMCLNSIDAQSMAEMADTPDMADETATENMESTAGITGDADWAE